VIRAGRRRVAAVGVAALLALAPAATGVDISGAELRDLAGRAATDPAARATLERIDAVDGQPVDVGRALRGAEGDDLERRLDLVAEGAGGAPPPSGSPSREAGRVLDERRFHDPDLPQPLRRPLEWTGERIEWLAGQIARPFGGLGSWVGWAILAALLVLAATFVALRLVRRGTPEAAGTQHGGHEPERPGPSALERQADACEAAGELREAIRLRFRAGTMRLAAAGAIPRTDAITSGDIAARLRLAEFAGLATSFDRIVYGGRPAGREDARLAREGWDAVMRQIGSRRARGGS
jgi:hypothetical protein